jgi:hypothetical protein
MWTPHSAASAVHPNRRNGSAHVPAGTSQRAQRLNAILERSSRCPNSPVEDRAGCQHRVHRNRPLLDLGNGSALEADPLPELEAPGAGQDDRCRLEQKPAHMAIAAAGEMAVIVNHPRLVTPGRQAKRGADRAGPPEVVRIFNGGNVRRRYRLPPDGFAGVLPLPAFAKGEAGIVSFGFSFFGFFASRLPRCSPLAIACLPCSSKRLFQSWVGLSSRWSKSAIARSISLRRRRSLASRLCARRPSR